MNLRAFLFLLLSSAVCLPVFAGPPAAERKLAVADAKKIQIRHSMMGVRDTLLFYDFADQRAVLVLRIDNRNDTFPVSGTVYLFDPETTAENLERWINNQHSDGLFPDVPTPAVTSKLPAGICSVTSRKVLGDTKEGPDDTVFRDYQVTVSVKEHRVAGRFRLEAFTDDANVYLKAPGK